MHRYQPRVHLVRRMEGDTTRPIVDLEREQFRTYVFPETVFTAVTAYQNQLVCSIQIQPVILISILPLRLFIWYYIYTLFHKVTKFPICNVYSHIPKHILVLGAVPVSDNQTENW